MLIVVRILVVAAAVGLCASTAEAREAQNTASIHIAHVSPAQVRAALQAPCAIRQWLGHVDDIAVLSHPAPNQTLVYLRQDLPWPWHERDVVSRFTVARRHNGFDIEQVNVPGVRPITPGVVRIPSLHAEWQLRDAEPGTRVVYSQHIVLGGHVPVWLSERASGRLIHHTLTALDQYMQRTPAGHCETD